jgi:hypothetical protein
MSEFCKVNVADNGARLSIIPAPLPAAFHTPASPTTTFVKLSEPPPKVVTALHELFVVTETAENASRLTSPPRFVWLTEAAVVAVPTAIYAICEFAP